MSILSEIGTKVGTKIKSHDSRINTLENEVVNGGSLGSIISIIRTDRSDHAANSFFDVFSLTITPSNTNSRVKITGIISAVVDGSNDGYIRILRNGSLILAGTGAGDVKASAFFSGYNGWGGTSTPLDFIDTPNTTNDTTYTIQAYSSVNSLTINGRNPSSGGDSGTASSTLQLQEIGA